MKWIRLWPVRALRVLALALVSLAVLLLLTLRLDHRRETLMPALTGPYAVTRALTIWEDARQSDAFAPEAGTPRRLIVWIWYPVDAPAGSKKILPYLPPDWRAATERQRGTLISGFLTRDLSKVHARSLEHSGLVSRPGALPVLIMRAGLSAQTSQYSSLAEDLASHGYAVVGFDAPYRTALVVLPDGTVIPRSTANNVEAFAGADQDKLIRRLQAGWASDIGFALDQLAQMNESAPSGSFAGRLDLDRVGVFGHSLGGATATQFCHDDVRCKAGIDIDGALRGNVIREGLPQPFLFLASEHDASDPETMQIMADIRGACAANVTGKEILALRGANHFGFSDDGALLKSPGIRHALHAIGIGGMDGPRQLALTKQIVRSFFDVHLAGAPVSTLDQARSQPEVVKVGTASQT